MQRSKVQLSLCWEKKTFNAMVQNEHYIPSVFLLWLAASLPRQTRGDSPRMEHVHALLTSCRKLRPSCIVECFDGRFYTSSVPTSTNFSNSLELFYWYLKNCYNKKNKTKKYCEFLKQVQGIIPLSVPYTLGYTRELCLFGWRRLHVHASI